MLGCIYEIFERVAKLEAEGSKYGNDMSRKLERLAEAVVEKKVASSDERD